MCMLNDSDRTAVRSTLTLYFIAKKMPFTGYEVFKKHQERIAAKEAVAFSTPVVHMGRMGREVSAYVRELFNAGEMPGWASTQVIPKEGPVLYFWITPAMGVARRIEQIRADVEVQKQKVTGVG